MHMNIGVREESIYPFGLDRGITSGFWHGYSRRSRALNHCSSAEEYIALLLLFQAANLRARSAAISHIAYKTQQQLPVSAT